MILADPGLFTYLMFALLFLAIAQVFYDEYRYNLSNKKNGRTIKSKYD